MLAFLIDQHVNYFSLRGAVVIFDDEALVVEAGEDLAPGGSEDKLFELALLGVKDGTGHIGD